LHAGLQEEFHVAGPACENERSPNFVLSRGISKRHRV